MKNIPLLIIFLVLITMLLSSCSTSNHARRMVKRGKTLIDRGIKLDPRLADSVYRVKDVAMDLPSIDSGSKVKPALDSADWMAKIAVYDTLLQRKNELIKELQEPDQVDNTTGRTVNKPDLTNKLAATEKQLAALRKKFLHGFAKDSTYTVHPDTLTTIDIFLVDGLVDSVGFHRDQQTVTGKVQTLDVNLNQCPPRVQDPWWWAVGVGSLILGFVLAILVSRWSTRPRQS